MIPREDVNAKFKGEIVNYLDDNKYGFIKSRETLHGQNNLVFHIRDYIVSQGAHPRKNQKVVFFTAETWERAQRSRCRM